MSLAYTNAEIRSEIGAYLGYGRDKSRYKPRETEAVEAWLKGGLQRFLFNTIPVGTRTVYPWSFLRKRWDFTTVEDQEAYDLPGDFGSAEGNITYSTAGYEPISFFNEAIVSEALSREPESSGTPLMAATRFKRVGGDQRQEILLYPRPSGEWTLRVTYLLAGDLVNDEYPPGGAQHSRTILYACLAEASRRSDDAPLYESDYQQALMASISMDSRNRGPNLGYNGDHEVIPFRGHGSGTITFDGVEYDGQ